MLQFLHQIPKESESLLNYYCPFTVFELTWLWCTSGYKAKSIKLTKYRLIITEN